MEVYKIGGNNNYYYKLRDICGVVGVEAGWNTETSTILLKTK